MINKILEFIQFKLFFLYLLKTFKYWITFFIFSILLLSIGISFSSVVSKSILAINTWNNTTSKYVAYDKRQFSNNAYIYYDTSVFFGLQRGDGIVLNAEIYQFLDDSNYDIKSIINEKNIYDGRYKKLEKNEVAISKKMSQKYKLSLEDKIYLNNESEYTIKFIFNDVYNIKKASIYSSNDVIFMGISDDKINSNYKYAVFDNITKEYNEVYIFSKAYKSFILNIIIYLSIQIILILIIQLIVFFIYKDDEIKTYLNLKLSGKKSINILTILGSNFLIIIIPMLIVSLILFLMNNLIISILFVILSIIMYLIKYFYVIYVIK